MDLGLDWFFFFYHATTWNHYLTRIVVVNYSLDNLRTSVLITGTSQVDIEAHNLQEKEQERILV